jgi:hypothetical protein
VTKKDSYPLPRVDDLLDAIGDSTWFSAIDLASGYWQIAMDRESQARTAFVIRNGLYEFKVMPFGLTNAPATFQRTMDKVLGELNLKCALVYIDDIIVFSRSFEEHLKHLRMVFTKISQANLKMNFDKCEFIKRQVSFLGHLVGKNGIKPDPSNVEKVQNYPTPESIKDVRGFLGLAGYYRKFIPNFAEVAEPLHKLLRKGVKFQWNTEAQTCFELLKTYLISEPILIRPNFDEKFILHTDASDFGIGAVLSQIGRDGREHAIAYLSCSLSKPEHAYSTTEREALAIVWAVKKLQKYLWGPEFEIVTDHQALKWLLNQPDPVGRIAR